MNQYFTLRRVGLIIPIFSLFSTILLAQNTSNKGTDFWIGYTGHINGGSGTGNSSQMNLYITSDVNTSGTVSIPLNGWSTPFTVTANNTTVVAVPPTIAYDGNSGTIENQGINVTSILPIVVYSHIYASDRSDATLALPVPTLGKEYYAMSFTQQDYGTTDGYSEFMVVGVEDSTQVQITPTKTTTDGQPANVPISITLMQGQVYQLQSDSDLTGSHIITYSSNSSACKRVAVFSGSTWDVIGCANGNSGDNLYQQMYPITAWGNNFITAPFKTRELGDYFRVFAGSDSTLVSVNGETPYLLNTGQFHDTLMATPNYITASKPITLAQYQLTQDYCNTTGDPSMTILSPVEQTLDSITLYSTKNYKITGEYINVIIKTDDTSNFRLDGNHVPFTAVPANPLYSYSQNTVQPYNHVLASDSGFNAIAYGFGQVESYGYNAGANVKNLYQYANASSNGIISPHILCNDAVVNFTGVVSYKPVSIEWYFGDGDTSSALNPVHTYNAQGTYTVSFVTVNGSAGNSCDTKDSSTYTLNIVGFPAAAFSFSNTCVTDTVSFLDGSSAGTGGSIVSWKWYFGDGDSSLIESPSYHYASAGTYNVKLIIKSSGGCNDSIIQPVTIGPQPNVNAGPDQNMCFGSSVILSTPAGSGYTYQWSPATSLSCSSCSSTSASPSDTQVYVIETTLSGCSAYDTVQINVIKPFVNIPADTFNICVGGTVLLSTDTIAGQTYLWSPSSGLSCLTCTSTNASPSATTKYFVTAIFQSCKAKDSTVVDVITPHAGPSRGICSGGSITLTATPGGAGVSYVWTPSTGLSCTNCQSPVATPTALPATYYVTISSSICMGSDSVVLTLETVPANAGKDDTICLGKSTVLSASGGVVYSWSPSAGLSSSTGANPVASPVIITTYTVIVTDSIGCTGSSSVIISLFPPFPNTAGPDTTVCIGDTVHLKASGGVAYMWQPGKLLSDSSTANPLAPVMANATYTVTITSIHDCTAEENVTLGTFNLPFVTAGPDTVICQNKPLQLTASGANTYQWSGGDILSCGTCATVNVGTANSGTFTVIGMDMNGCKNTASATVVLSQYCHFVLMPSAFTPDNDGHNDLFRPVGKGIVKVQYSVFDRWGRKLFTGEDLINGWDGKYNGVLQPIGTYVWFLSADLDDGTSVKQQGNVTLIR